jgi:hypothetical protein
LPLCESGEASKNSQRLVQDFLERDQELARLVAKLKQTRVNGEKALPPPEVELKSLERTKHLMKQRTSVMAVAIFFSLAPFMFTLQGNRITLNCPLSPGLQFSIVLWL